MEEWSRHFFAIQVETLTDREPPLAPSVVSLGMLPPESCGCFEQSRFSISTLLQ